MTFIIAQIVGGFGLLFAVISFQQNTRKRILRFQMVAATFFSVHMYLLGAMTGMVVNIVGIVRNILFYKTQGKGTQSRALLYFLIALYVIASAATYKNIFSIFPAMAVILQTVGLWMKNPKKIRRILIFATPCWFTYNFFNMSIAGMMTDVLSATSLIAAMLRYDYPIFKKKQEAE